MVTREVSPSEKNLWDNFVKTSPGSHIVQGWYWGEFKSSFGTSATRIAVFQDDKIVASCQYTLHKIPFSQKYVAYCPKGPICPEKKYLPNIISGIKKRAFSENCVFVRIEPNVPESTSDWLKVLFEEGLLKSPRNIFAPFTLILDLTKEDTEILSLMREKWRYNIKLATRKGVVVREGEKKDLDYFLALQKMTADRAKFFVHPDAYYHKLWEILKPQGQVYLLSAFIPNLPKPIASWLLFKYGDTLYYPYGGSDYEYRSFMGSHALMWAAVKLGKSLGCRQFDLWGATDSSNQTDPWFGFTRFKEGFGPKKVSFLGTFDLVLDPLYYKLFNWADKLRWLALRTLRF